VVGAVPGRPGPIQGSNNANTAANAFKGHSQGVKEIVSALGIKPHHQVNLTQQKGNQSSLTPSNPEVVLTQLPPDTQAVLNPLSIIGMDYAIAAAVSQEEVDRIKKNLKEIAKSTIDPKVLKQLLESLGVQETGDALIFTDGEGGLLVIQSSMKEIEESITEEE
jgi:hypothetical protein